MSKILSPKAWYLVGVGAAALVADGARRIIKRRRADSAGGGSAGFGPAEVVESAAAATPAPEKATRKAGADDLTELKGIGPTFARRLKEAGYTTYADIAAASADALREVTQAPAMANPEEWIAEARARLS